MIWICFYVLIYFNTYVHHVALLTRNKRKNITIFITFDNESNKIKNILLYSQYFFDVTKIYII